MESYEDSLDIETPLGRLISEALLEYNKHVEKIINAYEKHKKSEMKKNDFGNAML